MRDSNTDRWTVRSFGNTPEERDPRSRAIPRQSETFTNITVGFCSYRLWIIVSQRKAKATYVH